MKVIVPTNTVPNSIFIDDIAPDKGIIIVYKDQIPFGFVIYDPNENLYCLQISTMHSTGFCGYTIKDLLKNIQMEITGDISLEYFQTIDE